jgi:HEAT repeat protein
MAKKRTVEEVLAGLSALRGRPVTDEARKEIISALGSRVSFVVAKAADLARELKITGMSAELRQAFDRFLNDSKVSDKGCAAKTAVARAALELECGDEELFRAGIGHVQMEGSYGEPVDVAAELRGLCGMGLVQVRSRAAMNCLAELLNDRESAARTGAVRALVYSARAEAVLLLRFKALAGDREPAVIGECLAGLLSLEPREAMEFVGRFLDSSSDAIRDEAVLALGTSKEPAALGMLEGQYSKTSDRPFQQILLTSIAGLRLPGAVDFLISIIETERPAAAADALAAARIFRNDPAVRERIARAVASRADSVLRASFDKQFSA